jgi:hypothetical protein
VEILPDNSQGIFLAILLVIMLVKMRPLPAALLGILPETFANGLDLGFAGDLNKDLPVTSVETWIAGDISPDTKSVL